MRNKMFILFSLLILPMVSKASAGEDFIASLDFLTIFVSAVLVIVLFAVLFIFYALSTITSYLKPKDKKASVFTSIVKSLTDSVPVEKEESVMTEHVYDGIRELDNNLPPWWKYMFYATIVFAGVYMFYYHYSSAGKLQIQEYEHEVTEAKKEVEEYMKTSANAVDENNVKLLTDQATIDKGKSIYIQNCAACHGAAGEGGVGPNLTDEYWLHGGGVKNVFKTIKYGVPEKGMISWKTQLSPANIQEVTNYILSIQGTKPANGKAPQGEKYNEDKELAQN